MFIIQNIAKLLDTVFLRYDDLADFMRNSKLSRRIGQREVSVAALVGRFIDSYCPRCRLTLAHVVLYEVNGMISGVKCRTCGSEHRYHGPAPVKKRDVPAVRGRGGALAMSSKTIRPVVSTQWEVKNTATGQEVVAWDYKLTERYEKGDVIAHPRFGRGFVESVTMDKMEVLFREGRKLMAMNRAETPGPDGSSSW